MPPQEKATLKTWKKRKQDFLGDREHEKAVEQQSKENEKQRRQDKKSRKR